MFAENAARWTEQLAGMEVDRTVTLTGERRGGMSTFLESWIKDLLLDKPGVRISLEGQSEKELAWMLERSSDYLLLISDDDEDPDLMATLVCANGSRLYGYSCKSENPVDCHYHIVCTFGEEAPNMCYVTQLGEL